VKVVSLLGTCHSTMFTHTLSISVVPIDKTAGKHAWLGQQQFYEFYLNPLSLFCQGLSRVARRMLFDPAQGISADERIGGT
jgi:hypothetical protein